jgi:phospholipid/cholesterol/gamma-HCH transport system substrate-binding protein
MPSEKSRNVIVGLTILVAIVVCMYGIFLLGKVTFSVRQYQVILVTENSNGVTSGARVEMLGVQVGQVRSTYLTRDAAGNQVVNSQLLIDPNTEIPENATAVLMKPVTVGTPSVQISVPPVPPGTTVKMLPKDGTGTIHAVAGDNGLIPKEVIDNVQRLATDLTTVTHDLHTLLVYAPPESINPNDPAAPKANASTVIIRLDRTVASLQELLTDPKLQGSVRSAIQNISDASGQLKSTLEKLNDTMASANGAFTSISGAAGNIGTAATNISGTATQATATLQSTQQQIAAVTQKLVETLGQMDKSLKDITEGNGTTGMLVKDGRLYDGLLDLSRSLKKTADDLDFLVNKIRDEGVKFNLK